MPDQAFIYGAVIGVVVSHLVILRVPKYRAFLLRLPILKSSRK